MKGKKPVHPHKRRGPPPSPQPFVRSQLEHFENISLDDGPSDTQACLLANASRQGTEYDWQTVTTDQLLPPRRLKQSCGQVGSSLADVTDASIHELNERGWAAKDAVIQHPQLAKTTGPYLVRQDRQAGHQVVFARRPEQTRPAFPANSSRVEKPQTRQSAHSRAASAIKRLSNHLRGGDASQRQNKGPQVFELQTIRTSYETLTSQADSIWPSESLTVRECRGDSTDPYSWLRVRGRLGRSKPIAALTICDRPLVPAESINAQTPQGPPHVPHDQSIQDIATKLPCKLVSLQEAALGQKIRIGEGDEDHTEGAVEFAARSSRRFATQASSRSAETARGGKDLPSVPNINSPTAAWHGHADRGNRGRYPGQAAASI